LLPRNRCGFNIIYEIVDIMGVIETYRCHIDHEQRSFHPVEEKFRILSRESGYEFLCYKFSFELASIASDISDKHLDWRLQENHEVGFRDVLAKMILYLRV